MKVAEFTVRASAAQSANWKRAASAEGFPSVGGWLAHAADAQLRAIVRGGLPMPLGWVQGFFRVVLLDGRELPDVWGKVSPPFAIYQGDPAGPNHREPRTLVYLKTGAIIATLRTARQCRALAAELASAYARDPASVAGIRGVRVAGRGRCLDGPPRRATLRICLNAHAGPATPTNWPMPFSWRRSAKLYRRNLSEKRTSRPSRLGSSGAQRAEKLAQQT